MINNIPKFNRVLIVCHNDTVTGGPEAMHQLCSMLREAGCKSSMLYFADHVNISETYAQSAPPTEKVRAAYEIYNTKSEEEVSFTEDDLLIFPEILANQALKTFRCKVGIWWLSVDNALNWNQRLKYKNIRQPIFEKEELIHFYQSKYAHQYLIENGARIIAPLYDYTLCNEFESGPNATKKDHEVAIFPSKGAELASHFIKLEPDLRYVQITKMSKSQVYQTLHKTDIYIDFGGQPGKDRVPREAAICGCLVFLHRQGSAAYYEDSPLDDFFLFTVEDILSGNLGQRIKLALLNINSMRSMQQYYRNKIINEKKEFELQCINFFTIAQSQV